MTEEMRMTERVQEEIKMKEKEKSQKEREPIYQAI